MPARGLEKPDGEHCHTQQGPSAVSCLIQFLLALRSRLLAQNDTIWPKNEMEGHSYASLMSEHEGRRI